MAVVAKGYFWWANGKSDEEEEEEGEEVNILPAQLSRWRLSTSRGVASVVSKLKNVSIKDAKSWKPAVKSVLQYIQIVAMLGFSLELKFLKKFYETTKTFGLSNIDLLTVLPFGCYVSNNHHDKLVLYTMLPLAASYVMLTVYAVLRKSKTERPKNIADSAFGSFLSMNSFLLPMITTLIFSTFPCNCSTTGSGC